MWSLILFRSATEENEVGGTDAEESPGKSNRPK